MVLADLTSADLSKVPAESVISAGLLDKCCGTPVGREGAWICYKTGIHGIPSGSCPYVKWIVDYATGEYDDHRKAQVTGGCFAMMSQAHKHSMILEILDNFKFIQV